MRTGPMIVGASWVGGAGDGEGTALAPVDPSFPVRIVGVGRG